MDTACRSKHAEERNLIIIHFRIHAVGAYTDLVLNQPEEDEVTMPTLSHDVELCTLIK